MNPDFDKLRKLLNERIDSLTDDLASGRVATEEYRNVTGQIRGLKFALEFAKDAERELDEDMDSERQW